MRRSHPERASWTTKSSPKTPAPGPGSGCASAPARTASTNWRSLRCRRPGGGARRAQRARAGDASVCPAAPTPHRRSTRCGCTLPPSSCWTPPAPVHRRHRARCREGQPGGTRHPGPVRPRAAGAVRLPRLHRPRLPCADSIWTQTGEWVPTSVYPTTAADLINAHRAAAGDA